MLFNSFTFVIFFTIVAVLYYLLPQRFKWLWLLLSSTFFYLSSNHSNILVPIFIILISFVGGILIENASSAKKANFFFVSSMLANTGILVLFKYTNFFTTSIFDFINFINIRFFHSTETLSNNWILNIIAPLGISYITFQALGYLIEIKRGTNKAERNLGHFSTYIMFFPKLLSGPVERAHHFLPQLKNLKSFDYNYAVSGLKLIAWGLFKKVVIADRLGIFVNAIFGNVHDYNGITLIFGCIFSSTQLYADFSGYTDMALGLAKILGFDLMQNFNLPFSARSITEFWRKWHISLSTWFADYFYNPIAIRRRNWGKWSVMYASMLTFIVLGLWHGANWTYVVFGASHGLMLTIEFFTKKIRKKMRQGVPAFINDGLGYLFTFCFFNCSLIFFRARNMSDAVYFIGHLFSGIPNLHNLSALKSSLKIGLELFDYIIVFMSIALMQFVENKQIITIISTLPKWKRWSIYYTFVIVIFLFAVYGNSQFIYFQF